MIKRLLFILSALLMLFVALTTGDQVKSQPCPIHHETELTTPGLEQHHDVGLVLSSRTLSVSERCEHSFKGTSRLLELLMQNEQKVLTKISEVLLTTNSLKYSSLRIRSGHWVYVLRKILI